MSEPSNELFLDVLGSEPIMSNESDCLDFLFLSDLRLFLTRVSEPSMSNESFLDVPGSEPIMSNESDCLDFLFLSDL